MVEGNVEKWADARLEEDRDTFIISMWAGTWAPTMDLVFVGIEELAMRLVYDPLFWAGVEQMSQVSFPNALSMDYIGVGRTGDHKDDLSQAEHEIRTLAI